ncbi:MAG: restriction endonuclease [Verrucomicrobiae bacterium]|nr:restriction endonuclease [Verrucomicrobiae bacterium]
MSIPTYDQLLRPVLELAAQQDITRKVATSIMVKKMGLSEEEAKLRIPSGGTTYIHNRVGWAMSHLTKGGLISRVAKHTYRATGKGRDYLDSHKGPITPRDLKKIEGWKEAWEAASKKNAENKLGSTEEDSEDGDAGSGKTPEEMIDNAVGSLDDSLRSELLDQLGEVDPYFFERVVLDLLFAMGYGGSRKEAAQITKKSNDEGIDGVINEDRLGLDVIYVQAKRWLNTVGRKEIQSFVGALAGKQASKGVFITTSDFSKGALAFAESVAQKVILIDGIRLADLMIEYDVGVSTSRVISIKKIDSDYFEDS